MYQIVAVIPIYLNLFIEHQALVVIVYSSSICSFLPNHIKRKCTLPLSLFYRVVLLSAKLEVEGVLFLLIWITY